MNNEIFEFKEYKPYLLALAGGRDVRRGLKSKLAEAIGCQPTFLSQVLHTHLHLSLEQAEKASRFFHHSKEEFHYFLLLVQKDRAGTENLRRFFQEQLTEILNRRLVLTQRLGKKQTLSAADQSIYYSSWIYAAVHMALTIPGLRTREALSEYLHLPSQKVSQVLETLIQLGLAELNGSSYTTSSLQVRLGNDSPNIVRHHTNWRNQAIDSLDREELLDLHYSAVVSLSRADVARIKNLLMDAIRDAQAVVRDSPEEELCAFNLDLFALKKSSR